MYAWIRQGESGRVPHFPTSIFEWGTKWGTRPPYTNPYYLLTYLLYSPLIPHFPTLFPFLDIAYLRVCVPVRVRVKTAAPKKWGSGETAFKSFLHQEIKLPTLVGNPGLCGKESGEPPLFLPTLGGLVKMEKPHRVIWVGAGPRETPANRNS
jgi:hypothetical protein